MEDLPADFVLYTEWPEYLEDRVYPAWMQPRWVGEHPRGLSRTIAGFHIETYTSDIEPASGVAPFGRLQIWQRMQRRDVPAGWRARRTLDMLFASAHPYMQAVVRLRGDAHDFDHWPRHQRNQWRRWYAEGVCTIETVSRADFWSAYQTSLSWHKVPPAERDLVSYKLAQIDEVGYAVRFRIAREAHSGAILAGVATIDSREHKSSFYYVSFLCAAGRKRHAVMGLLEDWYTYAVQHDYSTLQLGKVWTTPEREGYSMFKRQFATHYISFPPLIYRYLPRHTV